MSAPNQLLQRLWDSMSQYTTSFEIAIAPLVPVWAKDAVHECFLRKAHIHTLNEKDSDVPSLPGVLLLSATDIKNDQKGTLLTIAKKMLPGRPIVMGGIQERDLLLCAINTWHALRMLPQEASADLITDAIAKAYETLKLEVALQRACEDLQKENQNLDGAIAELESTENQLLHTERLQTLGRVTSGLIAALRQHLQELERFEQVLTPVAKEMNLTELMAHASQGLRSIYALLDDIRGYSGNQPEKDTALAEDLDQLLERVATFGRFDALGKKRHVQLDLHSGAMVCVDRYRLHQAILNLLRNAFQATEPGGEIFLRTRRGPSESAMIEIEDNGCGMPEDVRRRLFEPFFTTKGEKGMGLGLRLSKQTIERYGGKISCESRVGKGTKFCVVFPLSSPSSFPVSSN